MKKQNFLRSLDFILRTKSLRRFKKEMTPTNLYSEISMEQLVQNCPKMVWMAVVFLRSRGQQSILGDGSKQNEDD